MIMIIVITIDYPPFASTLPFGCDTATFTKEVEQLASEFFAPYPYRPPSEDVQLASALLCFQAPIGGRILAMQHMLMFWNSTERQTNCHRIVGQIEEALNRRYITELCDSQGHIRAEWRMMDLTYLFAATP